MTHVGTTSRGETSAIPDPFASASLGLCHDAPFLPPPQRTHMATRSMRSSFVLIAIALGSGCADWNPGIVASDAATDATGDLDAAVDLSPAGECDPGSETATLPGDCGSFSCDPQTFACSGTRRGSVGVCQPCVADSECQPLNGVTTRCVRATWLANEGREGRYCLLDFQSFSALNGDTPRCPRVQVIPMLATSESGVESVYCAPSPITTCEAIVAWADTARSCSDESPCPAGSVCEGGACVVRCATDNDCLIGQTCTDGLCPALH